MTQIVQSGSINTTALVVPDLYVQIVPPQNLVLNGVPTNVVGVVGTAAWGPLNTASLVGSMADYAAKFGAVQNRKYDMGTAVATAVQQGAQNFRCVRVSDGTDAAATVTLSNAWTATARYTGTTGNSIRAARSAGSKAGTVKVVVSLPGLQPEIFDNIPGPNLGTWVLSTAYTVGQTVALGVNWYTCITAGTSAGSGGPSTTAADITDGTVHWAFSGTLISFWTALVAAINNGNGVTRGASQLITATLATGSAIPAATNTLALAGGTDGVATITAAVLIGVDTASRTGMYALRSQGCSLAVLADTDDSTQWTTQDAFGLSEQIYMICTGPASDTIANAVATKVSAGLDDYATKLMFGDWLYWNDQTNGVVRLVSPQGFVAGRLANLSPEQSSLNKKLFSVIGSQKSGVVGSGQLSKYSNAEMQTLFQAGIDLICNPQPGGAYWGVRLGHNSSSNPSVSGDNYTRLTNYISTTLAAGMGVYVGQLINVDLYRRIRSTLMSFLQNLLQQGILGTTVTGRLPFSVVCDETNNPDSRTSLGYVQADIQVRYQAINEKFIVNLEGGQTVTVNRQTLPDGQFAT